MNSRQRRTVRRAKDARRPWGRERVGRARIEKRHRSALRFFHAHRKFFVDVLPDDVEDRTVLHHFAALWKCMKEYRKVNANGTRTITVPNRMRKHNPGLGWAYLGPTQKLDAKGMNITLDSRTTGTMIIDHPEGGFAKFEGGTMTRIDFDDEGREVPYQSTRDGEATIIE